MYITDVISGTMADNDTNYLNNSSCPELTVKPSVSLKTNRTLAHSRFGFATKRFLWFFLFMEVISFTEGNMVHVLCRSNGKDK